MTPITSDPLAQRVARWAERISGKSRPTNELALQGWALRDAIRRRGTSAEHLIETIERHLPPLPTEHIPDQIEKATHAWNELLADLDSTNENFDELGEKTKEVFFGVLEALILAEDVGGDEETLLAQQLFNATVHDLYVFESMADVAAELERTNKGDGSHISSVELSDLFCAGIVGLFEGEVRVRARVEAEVEEFVPISEVVRKGVAGKPLTLAALEKRLAGIPFWFVKWAAQRLTLAVVAKSGDLHVYVWNGDNPAALALSQDLNGWQIRVCNGTEKVLATIDDANARFKLPKRIDGGTFTIQIKDAGGGDWIELFGRVGEMQ